MNDDSFIPLLVAGAALAAVGLASAAAVVLEEEERNRAVIVSEAIKTGVMALRKRQGSSHHRSSVQKQKRHYIHWDRSRARSCIMADYLGSLPRFSPDDFKRIFRVSRSSYQELRNILCTENVFFRERVDAANREPISTDAKILISLKYLAYGTSVNAFRDYFQLGESTAMECVKQFIHGIHHSKELNSKFFNLMSPADAKRIEALHYKEHGVRGMVGSLDCSHFQWGNCPVAYQGQYQGKEGRPTVVVEAVSDYSLYAWHAVFGYCGTLNDINIWESSLLHQSLCDGSFSNNDFPFIIGGETFHELWFLVDGIYPSLSRFVKPLTVPIDDNEAIFSMWQESKRKDIERFFGVFKKKIHFFAQPILFHCMHEITEAFYCCIILHNLAVKERVALDDGSIESDSFYEVVVTTEDVAVAEPSRMNAEAMRFIQLENENVSSRLLEVEFLQALGINVYDSTLQLSAERVRLLPQITRMAEYRWRQLYNVKAHTRLTSAIARELREQYNDYKRNRCHNNQNN